MCFELATPWPEEDTHINITFLAYRFRTLRVSPLKWYLSAHCLSQQSWDITAVKKRLLSPPKLDTTSLKSGQKNPPNKHRGLRHYYIPSHFKWQASAFDCVAAFIHCLPKHMLKDLQGSVWICCRLTGCRTTACYSAVCFTYPLLMVYLSPSWYRPVWAQEPQELCDFAEARRGKRGEDSFRGGFELLCKHWPCHEMNSCKKRQRRSENGNQCILKAGSG